MKKRLLILLFLLTAAFLLVTFTACGEDETTPPAGSSDNASPAESSDNTPSSDPAESTAPVSTDSPVIEAPVCTKHTPSESGRYCTTCYAILKENEKDYKDMIYFYSDNLTLNKAYTVAIADIVMNTKPYQGGLLTSKQPCIIAGMGYNTPWTRDCAINVWNAVALLDPAVAKNTLNSVLERQNGKIIIGGQYWDAILWVIGANQYILASGDEAYRQTAYEAAVNTLAKFEREEFDPEDNLFRGPAVYGDGVAAYPDFYGNTGTSGIGSWVNIPANAKYLAKVGERMPMKALSTNCVYYEAYRLTAEMAKVLGKDPTSFEEKAAAMKKAINDNFWNEEKGTYDYLVGPYRCDYQEALGVAYVLLFGIADERQTALVLENTVVTDQGIACVYPSFDRYLVRGGYGRHSGTVWPHAQGFWGRAALEKGFAQGMEHELFTLAERAARDGQFYEIYHPDTGLQYGGLQESTNESDIFLWGSCEHQTWSATGYLSIIYYELLGADIQNGSVTFTPYLPTGVNEITISGFKVGHTTFDIVITRGGSRASSATLPTTEDEHVTLAFSVR